MKGLSVRAPWWWFILHGGKNIENRDWPTNFRGTVYLHASKWFGVEEICEDFAEAYSIYKNAGWVNPNHPFVSTNVLKEGRGCIVGKIDIVDCVSSSSSPWFFGKYGFVLANPVVFPKPIPFRGALRFFEVPEGIEAAA
jgi:ASCH domain